MARRDGLKWIIKQQSRPKGKKKTIWVKRIRKNVSWSGNMANPSIR